MNRKGISPLIAAVLLIAFVIAVGGMFSEWSGELVRDSTARTTGDQQEMLDCTGRTINVDRVQADSNWLNVTLEADGGSLGNVTVTAFPAKQQENAVLDSAGVIDRVSFQINGNEQDRITAASTECKASIEHDLN